MEKRNNVNEVILIDLMNMNLKIPTYQRPYEWTKKNVYTLLEDILEMYTVKKSINLGTIILYENKGSFDIVDGQQRLITLSLLLRVMSDRSDFKLLNEKILCTSISMPNIKENYKSIIDYKNRLVEYDKIDINDFINYLETKVSFYLLCAETTEESFQLFDGRNTKYKDLSPVDLLKAYHLGAMTNYSIEEKKKLLLDWNKNINSEFSIDKSVNKIDYLYNNVLFRIYNWGLNKVANEFTKNDIFLYKGYKKSNCYNYVNFYRSSNQELFQINKPFKEGESFFKMTNYYIKKYEKIIEEYDVKRIIGEDIYYDYYHQIKYTNNLYYNALLLYKDRFGKSRNNIYDKTISDYIFKWSYTHRINNKYVKFSSINYYVLHTNNNFFFECNKALDINELLPLEIENKIGEPNSEDISGTFRSKLWNKV